MAKKCSLARSTRSWLESHLRVAQWFFAVSHWGCAVVASCKVPWHSGMTCYTYKRLNPNPPAEDVKLKSLATRSLWRQCVKCNHLIELAEGCYHMTCRCGYEFCYNCGAQWKDKKQHVLVHFGSRTIFG
ncbi:IBR domain [Sesbania bispinosa]|nr:IBR domain [Sesbania bispinosa]